MDTDHAVSILKQIAVLLELRQENRFKILAFENAARILEGQSADLNTLITSGALETLKGIGKGHIARILHELYETGKCLEYEKLTKEFPPTLFDLFHIPGLGSKRIQLLYDKLKIKSIQELQEACERNRLAKVKTLGAKTQENILRGIRQLQKSAGQFLISKAREESGRMLAYLKRQPGVLKIEAAGSVRRFKEVVHDIDILVTAKDNAVIHRAFVHYPEASHVVASGETKSTILLQSGMPCDLRTVRETEFPTALYYFTGSKDHNVAVRTLAKKHHIKINEYGVFKNGRRMPVREEADIFKAVGLRPIPPELRENDGEIEWAMKRDIPQLVRSEDIRGIFHVHSDASDGTAPLRKMIAYAEELGYEYVGISDHSQSAHYAHGLEPSRLRKQWKEIESIQKFSKIRIFRGVESDILPDGRLDYPDSILAQLDFVIGSIHSKFNLPAAQMTERIERAMENKYLTFLGHPTGRLLLQRAGYEVDFVRLFDAAKKNGVVMEVNAHPSRLDLDWRHLRAVKEKGVLVSINPDAHSLGGLQDVVYGVGIARKGWLEKKDVVNTLSPSQIEKFLARRK
ncbi:MAG: DNA polymerase/3'-5' exonuclease PolX [Candidatus Omnitrophica bacterium]|nr:DNA polymerase/3'-5' exonuclease PolX [Candidatus Omnitrophota bacterium]